MNIDEGYIKYECIWNKSPVNISPAVLQNINNFRNKLCALNMIGKIPNGPGFGNLSVRVSDSEFLISGTNTGHLEKLTAKDMSLVTKVNINDNKVWCTGMAQASSESMTHAAIYSSHKDTNAVVHIHYKPLWIKLQGTHPTTSSNIPYGTPEMAKSVQKLAKSMNTNELLVLGGHEDGIISFEHTLKGAYQSIAKEYERLE